MYPVSAARPPGLRAYDALSETSRAFVTSMPIAVKICFSDDGARVVAGLAARRVQAVELGAVARDLLHGREARSGWRTHRCPGCSCDDVLSASYAIE